MFSDVASLVTMIIALFSAVMGGVWTVVNVMSKKISEVSTLVYHKVDELEKTIVTKLENHETQDNQRFSSVSDGIWDLRVRMAAKEGAIPLPHVSNKDPH